MIWFEGWKAPLILTEGVFHLILSARILFFGKPGLILTSTPSQYAEPNMAVELCGSLYQLQPSGTVAHGWGDCRHLQSQWGRGVPAAWPWRRWETSSAGGIWHGFQSHDEPSWIRIRQVRGGDKADWATWWSASKSEARELRLGWEHARGNARTEGTALHELWAIRGFRSRLLGWCSLWPKESWRRNRTWWWHRTSGILRDSKEGGTTEECRLVGMRPIMWLQCQ